MPGLPGIKKATLPTPSMVYKRQRGFETSAVSYHFPDFRLVLFIICLLFFWGQNPHFMTKLGYNVASDCTFWSLSYLMCASTRYNLKLSLNFRFQTSLCLLFFQRF